VPTESLRELTVAVARHPAEQLELLGSGACEQRADELVLAAEQKQEHARARPDRGRQRPQRHSREPVLEHIAVSPLEQLVPAWGDGWGRVAHESILYATDTTVSVGQDTCTPRRGTQRE